MRARVLVVAAVALAAGLYLLRAVTGPEDAPSAPESVRPRTPARSVAEPAAAPSASLRNVFEYADVVVRAAGPPPRLAAAAPAPATTMVAAPPPAPAVRLVGLLRRGKNLKAALAITGETYVLGSGESAAGYTVLGIDEDEGVRVKAPDGTTIVLGPTSDR
jgi:hypothetical protein